MAEAAPGRSRKTQPATYVIITITVTRFAVTVISIITRIVIYEANAPILY